jgi:hypothetical protein
MSSIPLILGSLYAFIPLTLYAALMILHTYLDDKTRPSGRICPGTPSMLRG